MEIPSEIQGVVNQLEMKQPETNDIEKATNHFSEFLDTSVKQVVAKQQLGDQMISKLNSGEAQNLHDVIIAVEEADLSLHMLVQLRNKALEAYNTIIKMNI